MDKNKLNKSIVCITGGAGFIGINLVKLLLTYNVAKIYIIDDLSSGNKHFIPQDSRITFQHCDISNFEKYRLIFPKNVDYVFHLAAHFANQNSVDHPISDAHANVIGTINTLNICKDLAIKKLVYTSSSCVYGSNENMREDVSVYPTETPYAINKLCGEMYVKYFSEIYNIPALSVRIFNTYGPYELPGAYRNVIPNFIERALNGDPINITGTGDETRDFTYIDDTLDLLISMAVNPSGDGKAYNAGTGSTSSIKQLADIIIQATNSTSKIIYKPKRNWDHVINRVSDLSLSQQLFNYHPNITLEEGVQKTIEWMKHVR